MVPNPAFKLAMLMLYLIEAVFQAGFALGKTTPKISNVFPLRPLIYIIHCNLSEDLSWPTPKKSTGGILTGYKCKNIKGDCS